VVAQHHFRPATQVSGRTLNPPTAVVMSSVQDAWKELRKPASVMIAIDTSESMRTKEFVGLKEHVNNCLLHMNPADRVGLLPVNGSPGVDLALMDLQHLDELVGAVDGLEPGGGNALWSWIGRSVAIVRNDGYDPARINADVIVTDGTDGADASRISPDQLRAILEGLPSVRVFVLTYGSNADTDTLEDVVRAARGLIIPSDRASGDICQAVFDYF
jgi:Ca-activated chloride channel family protein